MRKFLWRYWARSASAYLDMIGGIANSGHGVSLPRHRKSSLLDLRTIWWRNRVDPISLGERVGRGAYDGSVSHRRSPLIPPSPLWVVCVQVPAPLKEDSD